MTTATTSPTSPTSTPASAPSGQCVELVRTAHDRGLRVIVDLVVNHTSNQHPWFRSARADPDSPYRDWYVWAEKKPDPGKMTETFPGEQDGAWSYDRKARLWYLHRFYPHQPGFRIQREGQRRTP